MSEKLPTPSKTIKALQSVLKKKQTELGKYRDSLRDMIADFESLAEACDTAFESIGQAVESLSGLV